MENRNTRGSGPKPTRTARISEDIWQKGKARAAAEGVSQSYVLSSLYEGYASGKIDLPVVQVVYPQRATDAGAPSAEPVSTQHQP